MSEIAESKRCKPIWNRGGGEMRKGGFHFCNLTTPLQKWICESFGNIKSSFPYKQCRLPQRDASTVDIRLTFLLLYVMVDFGLMWILFLYNVTMSMRAADLLPKFRRFLLSPISKVKWLILTPANTRNRGPWVGGNQAQDPHYFLFS